MRLPRDLSGSDLAQAFRKFGYSITRQSGSHLRLTTYEHGEHHLTIPQHTPLRIGTLSAILADVAAHFKLTVSSCLSGCLAKNKPIPEVFSVAHVLASGSALYSPTVPAR